MYTPTGPADRDVHLRVVVTALSDGPPTPSASELFGPIDPAVDAITPPALQGTPRVGQVLTLDQGTWTGGPTLAAQWRSCGPNGCTPLAATTQYMPTNADVGHTIRVTVTATSAIDQATETADAGPIAHDVQPVSLPAVQGVTAIGETLTADPGTWTGDPDPTVTVQWARCNNRGTWCSDIPGATGLQHTLGPDDLDRRIVVRATATNAIDSDSRESAPTLSVTALVSLTKPTIAGGLKPGHELQAKPGSWAGTPKSYAYEWDRCDPETPDCTPIPGATSRRYVVTATTLAGASASA